MATVQQSIPQTKRLNPVMILLLICVLLFVYHMLINNLGLFPEAWNLGLRDPLDAYKKWVIEANRDGHWMFAFFFQPIKVSVDFFIRRAEDFLFWLPWPVIVAFVFLLANKIGRLPLALITIFSLFAMGLLGLWDESMKTLALMVTAVIISLAIGIPLGIWTARNDRAEQFLRPILDAMQTMPAFVYLIPVVLFFGIARVPSVIATIIYAIPPAVRLTNLGIRRVPDDAIEAARAFGSTPRQILTKVQIPQALPSIMTGVNQTIMMALSIVVIAALIGGGGLGDVVLKSLRRLQVGAALEGGLAIVFMAVLLDRLSFAFSQIKHVSVEKYQGFRLLPEKLNTRRWAQAVEKPIAKMYVLSGRLEQKVEQVLTQLLPRFREGVRSHGYLITTSLVLLLLLGSSFALGWADFPKSLNLSLNEPVDVIVKWAQVNLYQIGDTFIGTGPFSDFVSLYLLRPLRIFLTEWLAWPIAILFTAAIAWAVSGWRLALYSLLSLLFIGWLGLWEDAADTLSQVLVAVLLSVVIGVPLGIWSARNDRAERTLRPILDFLQTIPTFVYLVPVIMLFNLGRVPGIMASVLYALAPTIRLTNLGIRQVDEAAVEAAESFGSTAWQTLRNVQVPLALPSIMLGINQTIMMVLAMVIIAGLVGAAGLGFEVVDAMQNNKMGASVEAGLAIVMMAIVLDRITQAWAQRQAEAANVG
jgi:glycine betaine/proline transport system permease protein